MRVLKLDEQSTGQWPDAAAGREMLDKEEEDEEDKEDKEEEEEEVEDGGEGLLALANGETALSLTLGKELSRHQGGPEIHPECIGHLSDKILESTLC